MVELQFLLFLAYRGSADLTAKGMDAVKSFQLENSKMYKIESKAQTETLGTALKRIKKRRSLFEHGMKYKCLLQHSAPSWILS